MYPLSGEEEADAAAEGDEERQEGGGGVRPVGRARLEAARGRSAQSTVQAVPPADGQGQCV